MRFEQYSKAVDEMGKVITMAMSGKISISEVEDIANQTMVKVTRIFGLEPEETPEEAILGLMAALSEREDIEDYEEEDWEDTDEEEESDLDNPFIAHLFGLI